MVNNVHGILYFEWKTLFMVHSALSYEHNTIFIISCQEDKYKYINTNTYVEIHKYNRTSVPRTGASSFDQIALSTFTLSNRNLFMVFLCLLFHKRAPQALCRATEAKNNNLLNVERRALCELL